jgi:hypothetical protein
LLFPREWIYADIVTKRTNVQKNIKVPPEFKHLHLRLPFEVFQKLRMAAAKHDVAMSALIIQLVNRGPL